MPRRSRAGALSRTFLRVSLVAVLSIPFITPTSAQYALRVGSTQGDQGRDVDAFSDGSAVVGGRFRLTAEFSPLGCSVPSSLTAQGMEDGFVARYNPSGGLVWAFRIGGTAASGTERVRAVDALEDGSTLVAGTIASTDADFSGTGLAAGAPGTDGAGGTTASTNGGNDAFAAKYNAAGELIWAVVFGSSNSTNNQDQGLGVAATLDGGAILTGWFRGTNVDFAPLGLATDAKGTDGNGGTELSSFSSGNVDGFVAKYNAAGELVWAFRVGRSSFDRATTVDVDTTGAVVVAGQFTGSNVDFAPFGVVPGTPGTDGLGGGLLSSNGDRDIWIARYNTDAELIFGISFGSAATSVADDPRGVAATSDNGVVVAGQLFTNSQEVIDVAPLGVFPGSPGTDGDGSGVYQAAAADRGIDGFLARYDQNGRLIYFVPVSSAGEDRFSAVDLTADDEAVVTGLFEGTDTEFDPLGSASTPLTSNGSTDVFVARYDTQGNLGYAFSFGGLNEEVARGIGISGTEAPVVTGYFSSSNVDFDPTAGTRILSRAGGTDVFVARYGPGGTLSPTLTLTGVEGWRHLGSPSATASFDDLLEPIWTQGATGSDAPSDDPTVFDYDETVFGEKNVGWMAETDLNATMGSGAGYAVYVFEDDTFAAAGVQGGFPKSLQVTGNEPASPVALPVSYTDAPPTGTDDGDGVDDGDTDPDDGWNLVANPFYDSIDWDVASGWTKTNVDNVVYVWDPNAASYRCWNGAAGDLANGCIAPYQGFWVKANANAPVVSVNDNARTGGATFYGRPDAAQIPVVGLRVQGTPEGADRTLRGTAFMSFHPDARTGKDQYDAYRLRPSAPDYVELFTVHESGASYRIDARPDNVEDFEVGLGVAAIAGGASASALLTLSWPELRDVPASWEITLTDTATGETIDLRASAEYTFEHTASGGREARRTAQDAALHPSESVVSETAGATRFVLRVRNSVTTATEEEASVAPVFAGLYPNPFREATTIEYVLPQPVPVRLALYDVLGREVAVLADEPLALGRRRVHLDGTALAAGVYVLRLDAGAYSVTRQVTRLK